MLLDFEHADIDRPIIVGTIFDAHVPTLDAVGLAQWLRCSNGGTYHVWDGGTKQWVRNKNILCDPATGNIG